jgi:hypothetical protein
VKEMRTISNNETRNGINIGNVLELAQVWKMVDDDNELSHQRKDHVV